MREIGTFDAKNTLSALLDEVEMGGEIIITRHGKPVARMVPATASFNRDVARQTVQELLKASSGVKLSGLKLKDLINEGRP